MQQSLNEQRNSMMQSVSKNIGLYDLTPEPLYTGRNSEIFHIANRNDRKSHALKVIYKRAARKTEEAAKKAYHNQRRIHESLKNRYIVQLENAFTDENNFYLVMEYCSKGNLRSLMKEGLTIETIKEVGLQIAKGLLYLHKSKIVHGDLKPENVLLTSSGEVKLCDFGESFKFEEKSRDNMRGEMLYAPPEVIQIANEHRDIWAFGCLLHEMATGKPPFSVKSWKELTITLTPTYLKNYPYSNALTPPLLHLLKHIFIHDYSKRLKTEELLSHPFFTNEPLPATLPTEKSEEFKEKKAKSSRSKATFRSLELKQNKQNKNSANLPVSSQPDYKKLLEKKFKEQSSRGGSKQNSDKKLSQKTAEQCGKQTKAQLTFNVRKNAFQTRKTAISPLKTDGMVIKEIDKKKSKIMIDKQGFTRCGESDWMNISPDGKVIRFRKNGTEKIYSFEALPEKYYEKYEQAKKIVKEAMTCTPKVTYQDQDIELTIMYNNLISAKFTDGPDLKGLELEKILKNSLNLDAQRSSLLQNVTLALISLRRR